MRKCNFSMFPKNLKFEIFGMRTLKPPNCLNKFPALNKGRKGLKIISRDAINIHVQYAMQNYLCQLVQCSPFHVLSGWPKTPASLERPCCCFGDAFSECAVTWSTCPDVERNRMQSTFYRSNRRNRRNRRNRWNRFMTNIYFWRKKDKTS